MMFVDSASRLQRPYGTRDKSAEVIIAVVKRFSRAWVFQGRSEATMVQSTLTEPSSNSVTTSESVRKLTVPYTPQQNGPVESVISRALKAGHAACLEAP